MTVQPEPSRFVTMTAQSREILYYQGEKCALCTEPLGEYFELVGTPSPFAFLVTSLRRGYIGTWEIVADRLYLIDLTGNLTDGSRGTLTSVFPDFPQRVFAHWYSGTLRVPQGECLRHSHGGCSSVLERDLFLDVEKGVLTGSRVRENHVDEPAKSAP